MSASRKKVEKLTGEKHDKLHFRNFRRDRHFPFRVVVGLWLVRLAVAGRSVEWASTMESYLLLILKGIFFRLKSKKFHSLRVSDGEKKETSWLM